MNEFETQNLERQKSNAFMHRNFIEMVSVEKDHAVFKLNIRPESRNSYGIVHGSAIYALADSATGAAAGTDGLSYVTETSALHLLRNQMEGEVTASAWVRHRGKSTVLTSVDVIGEDDRLLATGEFTFFRVDEKRLLQYKLGEK